jgi:hypothetical protein
MMLLFTASDMRESTRPLGSDFRDIQLAVELARDRAVRPGNRTRQVCAGTSDRNGTCVIRPCRRRRRGLAHFVTARRELRQVQRQQLRRQRGTDVQCTPRHRMPFSSMNEGSRCAWVTRSALSIRPYRERGSPLRQMHRQHLPGTRVEQSFPCPLYYSFR